MLATLTGKAYMGIKNFAVRSFLLMDFYFYLAEQ